MKMKKKNYENVNCMLCVFSYNEKKKELKHKAVRKFQTTITEEQSIK